jgi:hypothetical protein
LLLQIQSISGMNLQPIHRVESILIALPKYG